MRQGLRLPILAAFVLVTSSFAGVDSNRSAAHADGERSGGDRAGRWQERREQAARERAERVAARIEGGRLWHVEHDAAGRERRPGEVVFFGTKEDLERVRAAGFEILSQKALADGDAVVARIAVRLGQTVEHELDALKNLTPGVETAPNYLYRPSADEGAGELVRPLRSGAPRVASSVGIIDTGVHHDDPLLVQSIQAARSFVERYTPRKHGTRVAQIVAASGLKLQVADVFESDERGNPVASADAIARAIDWLAGERRVPVVNISVSGPYNAVLERMVARARATGAVLVAAAGNEGPNAAPAFPAALDGVIAVTAVDERGRVYARANQGAYIDFAAYAVGLPLPSDGGARVSGTSYAAPKVSAIIARRLAVHGGGDPEAVIRQLTKEAVDLGYRGRDPVFGWGELR